MSSVEKKGITMNIFLKLRPAAPKINVFWFATQAYRKLENNCITNFCNGFLLVNICPFENKKTQ